MSTGKLREPILLDVRRHERHDAHGIIWTYRGQVYGWAIAKGLPWERLLEMVWEWVQETIEKEALEP